MKTTSKLSVLSLVLLGWLAGCAENPVTGKSQLVLISKEQEVAMGKESAPEFEKQFEGLHPDAQLQGYVQRIGAQVAQQSDREMPYEFALLNSSIPNAFALPGGKVYVTAGLFGIMNNERQLAAVIGHEIGHIAAMHSVNMLQRQLGTSILLEAAGMAMSDNKYKDTALAASQVAFAMVDLRYSREHEYEADAVGTKYLERAGYNPWGMVELLESLKALNEEEPGKLAELFLTHPLTSARINNVKTLIAKQYPEYKQDAPAAAGDEFARMKTALTAKSK